MHLEISWREAGQNSNAGNVSIVRSRRAADFNLLEARDCKQVVFEVIFPPVARPDRRRPKLCIAATHRLVGVLVERLLRARCDLYESFADVDAVACKGIGDLGLGKQMSCARKYACAHDVPDNSLMCLRMNRDPSLCPTRADPRSRASPS